MASTATSIIKVLFSSNRSAAMLLLVILFIHAGLLYLVLTETLTHMPAPMPRSIDISLIRPAVKAANIEHATPAPKTLPPKPAPKRTTIVPVLTAKREATALPADTAPVAEPVKPAPAVSPVATEQMPAALPDPAPVSSPHINANYLDNPKPPYPPISRLSGEEGTVLLRVYVNADGTVGKLELQHTSGFFRLDRSAMDTVTNWRFTPAHQGNQAIAAWVVIPVSFNLRSK
jgi:periplasmic protein TonB